jgi:Mrp family chromosome partitioning ATPase
MSASLMRELVQELKHFYPNRYVLFDLPPLLSFADALAFAPMVDASLLVVEATKTRREDVQQCLEMLKDFKVLGTILNKMPVEPQSASRYYQGDTSLEANKNFLSKWFK